MDAKKLMSEDPKTAGIELDKAIIEDKISVTKSQAKVGQNYYDYKHDILGNRIFYMDDKNTLTEDKGASNVKIPHPFFTEQVDQKIQYLLSNPIGLESENEDLKEALKEYYTDEMQLFLQESLEGAAIKGHEFVYARTNNKDRLCFEVSDSLQTFEVTDDFNEVVGIIRYYDRSTMQGDKKVITNYAEIWNDSNVTFYRKREKEMYTLDISREINPRPHIIAESDNGELLQRSYGLIPFYKLSNNKKERTDLEPIKALIDDYDLMACFLSNNLQDFAEAIYVVKGFRGDDLTDLRQNVKSKKVIGTGADGGLDIKTVEIPIAARQAKLEIDKDAIYKFGMGFDSTQIGDGNITNVVIKSRYALLDMKANKAEVRLKAMIYWINKMIVDDINRRFGTNYDVSEIKVTVTRETMVNEKDIVERAKIEAETQQIIIQTILAVAPRLDDSSALRLICEQFDLDFEEIEILIDEADYKEPPFQTAILENTDEDATKEGE